MSSKNLTIYIEGNEGFKEYTKDLETDLAFLITFDPEPGEENTIGSNVAMLGSHSMDLDEFAETWAKAVANAVTTTFDGAEAPKHWMTFEKCLHKEMAKHTFRQLKSIYGILDEIFKEDGEDIPNVEEVLTRMEVCKNESNA